MNFVFLLSHLNKKIILTLIFVLKYRIFEDYKKDNTHHSFYPAFICSYGEEKIYIRLQLPKPHLH